MSELKEKLVRLITEILDEIKMKEEETITQVKNELLSEIQQLRTQVHNLQEELKKLQQERSEKQQPQTQQPQKSQSSDSFNVTSIRTLEGKIESLKQLLQHRKLAKKKWKKLNKALKDVVNSRELYVLDISPQEFTQLISQPLANKKVKVLQESSSGQIDTLISTKLYYTINYLQKVKELVE